MLQPPLFLTEEDEPLACELFEQVFKHAISPAHWRWKYHEGPRLGKLQLGIKSDRGQLIAHAGATVFEGQYKDSQGRIQSLPMAQVCDVMVHESARNSVTHQGAYGQVIHALQTQLALDFPGVYAYGFSGIRPYKLGVKMGLYKCHQDYRMGQVSVPEKAASQSIASTLTAFFKSEKLIPLHTNKQDPSEFFKYQSHFDEWSVAWGVNEVPKVLRTAAYLQWRFIQNPSAHYQFWLYKKGGTCLAWLVTRELSPGQLTLVDALMHPKLQSMLEPTLPRKLQQNILNAFQRHSHVKSLSSWHIETAESRQLEPIKAGEVKVGNWHACKSPVYWPADTDVF